MLSFALAWLLYLAAPDLVLGSSSVHQRTREGNDPIICLGLIEQAPHDLHPCTVLGSTPASEKCSTHSQESIYAPVYACPMLAACMLGKCSVSDRQLHWA